MELVSDQFGVSSDDRFEVRNVTPEVQAIVEEVDASSGLVYVTMPHTSAALSTNEDEAKLRHDMVDAFKRLAPPDDGYYHDVDHIAAGEQPNAHAHLVAAMIDTPVLIVLRDGELQLGQWEAIQFYELCGPRDRSVEVHVLH